MRLINVYRMNSRDFELDVIPNLFASLLIISVFTIIFMKYGMAMISHAKAISAYDILPYKEDYAVRLAITGERKIETAHEDTKLLYATVSHTKDTLVYRFTENPSIDIVSWHVEESASNTYLFLSWMCDVSYAKTDWLINTFNGNALLCK